MITGWSPGRNSVGPSGMKIKVPSKIPRANRLFLDRVCAVRGMVVHTIEIDIDKHTNREKLSLLAPITTYCSGPPPREKLHAVGASLSDGSLPFFWTSPYK